MDSDADGLPDYLEIQFKADPDKPDSDNDGYKDGLEVEKGYDPTKDDGAKLKKRIEVDLAKQELKYYLGPVQLGTFRVSTGKKSTPTPKGTYVIKNKALRPLSISYHVYMPYWMGLSSPGIGIHDLPEWGVNKKEPVSTLGTPASHGCIRLASAPAKKMYEWAEVGTEVKIY